MIRFIDVNTGNVYNGSTPYVHWFEGKQSVGLNYDKQIVFLTNSKCVCIKMNSDVFSLVNEDMLQYYFTEDGKPTQQTFFDKKYFDLDVLKTKHISKTGNSENYQDGYYLYCFNIIAQGKYVGEVTDSFFINDEEFTIGADFYDENEILGINLSNFGLDISNEVQRAIYEKDINEQKPDYILLNRKLKELLNEYINILANKGSYKSLINSLNWFEYGELTKIYEYWKHSEPNRDYISKRELTQYINQNTKNIINSQTKTTFVGISCALDKITKNNGKIVYENSIDESNIFEEPTYWGYSPLQYVDMGGFFANSQWCTVYNKDKTVTFRLAVDREITGFAPQISFAGNYVGMEYNNGYYEYTTSEKYEYGELLPEVWFFWLASYYGAIGINIPYNTIGSKNNRDSVILPTGWNWIIPGGNNNTLSLINEPNPKLENVGMMWSKDAMSLKMTLLHNFFATYFLPIHLDLIHTTIENIIYTNTLKINSAPLLERFDRVDGINTFKCDLKDVYYLDNVETYTNLNTPFGYIHNSNLNEEDAELDIIGVDLEFFDHTGMASDDDILKAYMLQYYKGIGAVIPFNCVLDIKDNIIVGGDIIIYKDGEIILSRSTTNIRSSRTFNIGGKTHVDFNILLKEIGQYKIQLQFRLAGGENLIKTFDLRVDEENYPSIKLYKIVPKNNIKNELNINEWIGGKGVETNNVVDYVLNPVQYKRTYYNGEEVTETSVIYTQFISTTAENIKNTVHSNQVFILKLNKKDDIRSFITELNQIQIKDRNGSYMNLYDDVLARTNTSNGLNPDDESKFIIFNGYSKTNAKDIFWFTMDRGGNFLNIGDNPDVISEWINYEYSDTGWNDYIYIIGINTSFNIPENTDCSHYTFKDNRTENRTPIWIRNMFIPYFYKLEEIGKTSRIDNIINGYSKDDEFVLRNSKDTYIINQTDVICFLPELKCVRRPKDFMWKFYCSTVNKTIIPLTFRRSDMNTIDFELKDGEGETIAIIEKQLTPNDNRNNQKTPYPTILQPLFGRYDFSILPTLGYYDLIFNYRLDDNQEKDITKQISSSFIVSKKNATKSDLPEIPTDITPDIPEQDELRLYLEEILRRTNAKHGFKEEYLDDYEEEYSKEYK